MGAGPNSVFKLSMPIPSSNSVIAPETSPVMSGEVDLVVGAKDESVVAPSVAVTVIVDTPTGVAGEVVMVIVEVQVGVQEGVEYEAVAPLGRPDSVKDTGAAVPEVNVAVRVLVMIWPAVTV